MFTPDAHDHNVVDEAEQIIHAYHTARSTDPNCLKVGAFFVNSMCNGVAGMALSGSSEL